MGNNDEEQRAYRLAMSAELRQIRQAIDEQTRAVEQNTKMLRDIHEAVFGNGNPEHGLRFRVRWLEKQISSTPTWQWIIEKALLPILMLLVGAIVGIILK